MSRSLCLSVSLSPADVNSQRMRCVSLTSRPTFSSTLSSGSRTRSSMRPSRWSLCCCCSWCRRRRPTRPARRCLTRRARWSGAPGLLPHTHTLTHTHTHTRARTRTPSLSPVAYRVSQERYRRSPGPVHRPHQRPPLDRAALGPPAHGAPGTRQVGAWCGVVIAGRLCCRSSTRTSSPNSFLHRVWVDLAFCLVRLLSPIVTFSIVSKLGRKL
jgi:hypothetical protein